MICEITPSNGPWFEITKLLKLCDEAFNESAASISRKGMPMNRIACVAHMLCDERFLACIIPLTVGMEAGKFTLSNASSMSQTVLQKIPGTDLTSTPYEQRISKVEKSLTFFLV